MLTADWDLLDRTVFPWINGYGDNLVNKLEASWRGWEGRKNTVSFTVFLEHPLISLSETFKFNVLGH